MTIPIYQVDAFTQQAFGGNPAAVCPMKEWLSDDVLLKIAQENNLAETAYFIPENGRYHLRWFTPEIEMDLCGHATLASAHVIFEHLGHSEDQVSFTSKSGELYVRRDQGRYQLDFPARPPEVASAPEIILNGIGGNPRKILKARDYLLIYDSEEEVAALNPNESLLREIDLGTGGIIATAPGKNSDFVSRFFTPGASVFEDPATGSAHCSLIPYWSERLGKTDLHAYQISARLGELFCRNAGERVLIGGYAVTVLKGEFLL